MKIKGIFYGLGLILAIVAGTAIGQTRQPTMSQEQLNGLGDIPTWARWPRIYQAANNGHQHWLAEVLGCLNEQALAPGATVQCGEVFVYIRPAGDVGRALGAISNIQVAGHVGEADASENRIGTVGNGRVDRAVLYDGLCYGNVGQCISLRASTIEFQNGWQIRESKDGLEIVRPDGTVRELK